MKLVLDASVTIAAAANPFGFERFRQYKLVAPPLMWVEAVSSLHAMLWRGELRRGQAESMRDRVFAAPVRRHDPDGLAKEVWNVAEELGWAKTMTRTMWPWRDFSAAASSRWTHECDGGQPAWALWLGQLS